MEMDNSLLNSLNELVSLQRQQIQKISDLSMQQAEQLNLQKQQNLKSPGQSMDMSAAGYYGGSYPASAPRYMPQPFNVAGNINAQARQFQGQAQSLRGNGQNYGFFDTFFPNNSISPETRNMMTQDLAGRSASAAIGGIGTAAQVGLSLGTMSMGLIPGIVGGVGGGALVGAFFNNGQEQAKVQNEYTKYLQRESYRFINTRESNNDRGYGGFSLKESQQAANFLRTANSEFYMKDEDMMGLVRQYTDSGMLRDIKGLESFKEKIRSLTKNVKSGALLLNETYESITGLMSEMKKMGINEGSYNNLMSLGRTVGTELGKSGSEVTRTLMSTAGGMTQGTGLSNDSYMYRLADTYSYTNYMYEDLKNRDNLNAKELATKNYINNNGGVEGVSAQINQIQDTMLSKYKDVAAAFYDYDSQSDTWKFNQDTFTNFVSGAKNGSSNLSDLYDKSVTKLNQAGKYATKDWQDNYHLYLGNEMQEQQISDFTQSLAMAYNRQTDNGNVNDLDTAMSLMMKGTLSPDQIALYSKYMSTVGQQGSGILMQQYNTSAYQTLSSEMQANQRTIFGQAKAYWEDVKEGAGAFGAEMSNDFGSLYTGLNDKLLGKTYVDLQMQTDTDWSLQGIKNFRHGFYDTANQTQSTLRSFRDAGFNIDQGTIDLFNIEDPNKRSFEYSRKLYANPQELSGVVGANYESIHKEAGEHNLSETILGALLKFSGRSEGQKLFGASEDIVKKIAESNSLKISDPGSATVEEKLKLAAEAIEKLVFLYGGNEDLAMKAFFGGQQTVDAQLRAMGYDVDKLRNSGTQGTLVNVDGDTINVDSPIDFSDFGGSGGFNATDPGIHFNVNGSLWQNGDHPYEENQGYVNGKGKGLGSNQYDDMIYQIANQVDGVSPNALASLVATESSGRHFNKDGSLNIGGSGEIGMTQVMPGYDRWTKYLDKEIKLNNGETYVIGSDEKAKEILKNQGKEAAFAYELSKEEVNLYVGAKEWSEALRNSTTDKTENPDLAYAYYTGGGGYTKWLHKMAIEKAGMSEEQYNQLNANGIMQLSSEYEQFAPTNNDGTRYPVVMKAKNVYDNWDKKYRKAQYSDTQITANDVQTQAQLEEEKIAYNALTGEEIDPVNLNAALGIKANGLFSNVIMSPTEVNKMKTDYDEALHQAYNGVRNRGSSFGSFWQEAVTRPNLSPYEKEIADYIDANGIIKAENNTYFTDEMRDNLLLKFAQAGGSKLTSTGQMKSSDRAVALKTSAEWYKAQYDEIEKSKNGKKNSWDALSIGNKSQVMEMMDLMYNSNFSDGVDLGITDVTKLVGKDYLGGFTDSDIEIMKKVDKNGVYSEDNGSSKDKNTYKNTIKWLKGGMNVDPSKFTGNKASIVGLMGLSGVEAIESLESSQDDFVENIIGYEDRMKDIISSTESKNGMGKYVVPIPGLSDSDRSSVIKAMKSGDVGALKLMQDRLKGGDDTKTAVGMLLANSITQLNAKNIDMKSLDNLDTQMALINEQIAKSDDLGKLGQSVSALLGYSAEERKGLEDRMDFRFLSKGEEALRKEKVGDVSNKFDAGYSVVYDEVLGQLTPENLQKFGQKWNGVYDAALTNKVLEDYLTVGEDGSWKLDKTAEEVAGAILNVLAGSGDKLDSALQTNADGTTDAGSFSEAGKTLTDAVTTFSKDVDTTAQTLISTMEGINEKVNNMVLKTGVVQMPGSPRWVRE